MCSREERTNVPAIDKGRKNIQIEQELQLTSEEIAASAYTMSDAPTRGEGGDGNEEQLLVGNALEALLLAVHGAAGAAVVVHLRWRRRRRWFPHYSSSLCTALNKSILEWKAMNEQQREASEERLDI